MKEQFSKVRDTMIASPDGGSAFVGDGGTTFMSPGSGAVSAGGPYDLFVK